MICVLSYTDTSSRNNLFFFPDPWPRQYCALTSHIYYRTSAIYDATPRGRLSLALANIIPNVKPHAAASTRQFRLSNSRCGCHYCDKVASMTRRNTDNETTSTEQVPPPEHHNFPNQRNNPAAYHKAFLFPTLFSTQVHDRRQLAALSGLVVTAERRKRPAGGGSGGSLSEND